MSYRVKEKEKIFFLVMRIAGHVSEMEFPSRVTVVTMEGLEEVSLQVILFPPESLWID